MREDLRRMGVTNWRIHARRRDDWKMVVKEAKVLQGLLSHGVVVVAFPFSSACVTFPSHFHLIT